MTIHSYLILPAAEATHDVTRQLAALPGCDVVCAENRDLLILVTETHDDEAERGLQAAIARIDGIRSMSLTFGGLVQ